MFKDTRTPEGVTPARTNVVLSDDVRDSLKRIADALETIVLIESRRERRRG